MAMESAESEVVTDFITFPLKEEEGANAETEAITDMNAVMIFMFMVQSAKMCEKEGRG